jgi:type VI secretion system Hcp family effector
MPYGIYLKADDLKGGCQAKGHEDTIELVSVNHCMTLPTSFSQSVEGGLVAGDPQHDPITISYELCSASPVMSECLNTGKHLPKIEIQFAKQGGGEVNFYTITLEDVVVNRHQLMANSKSDGMGPSYEADLAYNKISFVHTTMDNKGSAAGKKASSYSLSQVAKA